MKLSETMLAASLLVLWPTQSVDSIPQEALHWRRSLTREAQAQWGLSAPVADFAAQIHQESAWKQNARSKVGAYGLAQFMPATADWIAGAYPDLGPNPQPASPEWAIRAMVIYDYHLWNRVTAATDCDRMAKALSSYNGGIKWIARDEQLAVSQGLDPSYWFGSTELVNSGRKQSSWQENRGYPRRILLVISPMYLKADWGRGVCQQ